MGHVIFLYIDNTLYGDIPYRFWDIGHFSGPDITLGCHFGGSRTPRSNFLVVLDGSCHVSYTLIIQYMVIILTVFEILDIFRKQILPSEAILGVPGPPRSNFLVVIDGPSHVSYTLQVLQCCYQVKIAWRAATPSYFFCFFSLFPSEMVQFTWLLTRK